MNDPSNRIADPLTEDRYSRQILFAPLGKAGQQKLSDSCVAIVGCGALGSYQAEALVRSGVGKLLLIDRDYVEPSNLHRQSIYDERDAEQFTPKARAAEDHLKRVNSQVLVRGIVTDLNAGNAVSELAGVDLILDGTDNFETRYLLNDVSLYLDIPWIYGAAIETYGITMTFIPGRGPCLTCIFPEPPSGVQPTCDTAGILNPTVSAVTSIQVVEAIKILSGNYDALHGKLLSFDLWQNRFHAANPGPVASDCKACQGKSFVFLHNSGATAATLCGRNAVQIHEIRKPIDFASLASKLESHGTVRWNQHVMRFATGPYQLTIFPDGRMIVKGTEEIPVAKELYTRFLMG